MKVPLFGSQFVSQCGYVIINPRLNDQDEGMNAICFIAIWLEYISLHFKMLLSCLVNHGDRGYYV